MTRLERSRKKLCSPRGQVFDLLELFNNLSREYFDDRLQVNYLGWSHRKSRRTLGHYDPAHKTITLSRWLDHPLVPQYVVEYVLFHEMLHVVLDEEIHGGKRRIHHRRFRLAEREFSRYEAARDFLRSHL
jgi:predicted metal-dependent hydrolase